MVTTMVAAGEDQSGEIDKYIDMEIEKDPSGSFFVISQ